MKLRSARYVALTSVCASALAIGAIELTGCKSSNNTGADAGTTATETACDPLAARPITLGAVVGVGTDASGTLYVDAANGVFVSDGGALVRQHVIGTGQSGSNEFIFTFEAPSADAASARTLLVETQGSTASAMALGPPNSRSFLNQTDGGVTSLTLVDPAGLAGMSVVNTPDVIEYIGDVANGDIVLATVPLNGDSASDDGGLSIFYGPPGAVAERTITAFGQTISNDGSVTFLVDKTSYVLTFGTVPSPDAGPLGMFTLEGLTPEGGTQVAVTIRSPTPTLLPAGVSFTCFP